MRVFDAISSLVAGTVGLVSPNLAARYLVGRETLRRVAGYGAARRDGPNGQWLADGRLLADTERLPASSRRLVMRRTRIGQILPVSWMHAVISTVYDLDEYQSSERIAARLAAAFGVFVVLPPEMPGNDLNGRPMPALSGGVDTMQRLISGKDFISQGRIDALPPGADIKVAEYNRPGGSYEPFVKTTQRSASAGMGLSHEAFSNDFSDASFSSVRQAVLEERRAYKMQQHFVVEELCRPLWKQWTARRAVFSQGSAVVPVRWQKPGWSWVDPLKDANASTVRVNLGIVSRRELCEEEGRDYDEVQQQLAEEKRLADTGGMGDLDQIGENEEYRTGSLSDHKESFRIYKYGKLLSISWEMIVNDDLSAFSRIPQMLGAATARKYSDIVYGLLTGSGRAAPTGCRVLLRSGRECGCRT